MQKLADTRIAITGAGSGLGRATALRFAREGWRVAVTDLDATATEATLAAVREAGGDGFALTLDVREERDFEALATRLRDEWDGVDVFVNNAGIGAAGSVEQADLAQWYTQIEINLLGVVRGCRAALPLMRPVGAGHIVNIASFAAIASAPGMASYNAAKAGVLSLSESLRGEVYEHGIGVSVVCPAFFATSILTGFDTPHPAQKALVAHLMEKSKISADDVAESIHAAVQDNRFMVIPHPKSLAQWHAKREDPEAFFHEVRQAMQPLLHPEEIRQ